jgi:hypothetical protein
MEIIPLICVFLICEYLREMNFFLSRRSTLILFSLIYSDFIRNHLHEYYAALQLRIVLLHFFCYKYYCCYAAQSVNCLLKYFPIEFYRHIDFRCIDRPIYRKWEMKKWKLSAPSAFFSLCEYLREMYFFLSRRSTQILFSQIHADFIRDHLHEYYTALQKVRNEEI